MINNPNVKIGGRVNNSTFPPIFNKDDMEKDDVLFKDNDGSQTSFNRSQRQEAALLDHISKTNPKLFREIQLREGAFDDRMSIEEIEDELRKLGSGEFTDFTDKKPVLPAGFRRNN